MDMLYSPDKFDPAKVKKYEVRDDGWYIINIMGVIWYTNIDIAKRHEPLTLFRRYADDPSKYPKYDNYDAIDVAKVTDIPEDYFGIMGVPITFLDNYCPEQFEILGNSCYAEAMPVPVTLGEDFVREYRSQGGTGHASANMYSFYFHDKDGKVKMPFKRILIRRR